MDVVDAETRSSIMSRVKGKDTKPEMEVRRFLHAHGYRYRLHRKDLPGKPDLVFATLHTCLFVHGCFWHRHAGCKYSATPKSRQDFWGEKFRKNVARDLRNTRELEASGWRVLVVWECQLREDTQALHKLLSVLDEIRASIRVRPTDPVHTHVLSDSDLP